jgi:hypothetical protein
MLKALLCGSLVRTRLVAITTRHGVSTRRRHTPSAAKQPGGPSAPAGVPSAKLPTPWRSPHHRSMQYLRVIST